MGNDITKSVKYVDTAATIYSTKQLLGRLVWSGMSDTHDLIIKNSAGTVLYQAKAGLANDYFEFDFNGMSDTLVVNTIDGGVLLIYPFLP